MAGLRDVLGEFGSRAMLILDEAHHAAPASGQLYAVESQFTRAVREIAALFQHRLFLTATPHNGHSNSFTALLEMLDPQRFTRGVEVQPNDLEPIMVRRLKEDLRKLGSAFPKRVVDPVILDGLDEDEPELKLSRMLADYGELRDQRIRRLKPREAAQAKIAFVGLQQRLLSSIAAFAKTLNVHRQSLQNVRDRVAAQAANAEAAEAFVATPDEAAATVDTDDETGALEDLAKEEDAATEAATELGAMHAETAALDRELAAVDEMLSVANRHRSTPDARVRRLREWIREHMHTSDGWDRRRLILFTEYEDTRRWLEARLKEEVDDFGDIDERIDTFTGITSSDRREAIKHAFNADPDHEPLRILICTDAAREGINLQTHCYDLFHIDLPWNPSRLEQRNGRIDRKLQPANEVYCRYFKYSQRETDIVLDALVRKTDRIQRQLGSVGKVVEERISNRLLEAGIARGKAKALSELIEEENAEDLHARAKAEMEPSDEDRLDKLRREHDHLRNILERSRKTVGVEPADLRHVVATALNRAGLSLPKHETEPVNDVRTFQLDPTNAVFANDPRWQETLDDLRERRPKRREKLSKWRKDAQVRKIAFEPPVQENGADADDVVQVHLEHRLVRRLLSRFISQGFQSGLERVCAIIGPGAETRVVMVGRLAVFGPGASRLHEEFITVTARWREAERDRKPLTPYGRQGEQTTFEQLEDALRDARDVPQNVAERLRQYAPQDARDLDPELKQRAEARLAEVKKDLAKRGDEEARTLTQLLEQQRKRIERAQAANDPRQTEFKFPNDAERRQFERDREHWEVRRQRIETELEDEPARVRASYEPKAHRLEPIGLLYLWPRTG